MIILGIVGLTTLHKYIWIWNIQTIFMYIVSPTINWSVVTGTWSLFFHSVGNFMIPTDELIFFRGVEIPPTSEYFLGTCQGKNGICLVNMQKSMDVNHCEPLNDGISGFRLVWIRRQGTRFCAKGNYFWATLWKPGQSERLVEVENFGRFLPGLFGCWGGSGATVR